MDKNKVIDFLLPIVKRINERVYIQTLFDPVQTHAVYGGSNEDIPLFKTMLKKQGANKFRVVKNNDFPILCFNASKIESR